MVEVVKMQYAYIDKNTGQVVFNTPFERLDLLIQYNPHLRYCTQNNNSEEATLKQLSKDYGIEFDYSSKNKQPGWYEVAGKT